MSFTINVNKGERMQKYILIVDDNPSDLSLAEALCIKSELCCLTAEDAYEALDYIHDEEENYEFSLVIVDLQMPKISGLELIKRIKATSKMAGVPIIVMSGRKTDKDISTSIRLGASDYIVKPMDSFIFEEKLLKHTGREDSGWRDYTIPLEDPARNVIGVQKFELCKISEISAEILTTNKFKSGDVIHLYGKELGDEQLPCTVESVEPFQDNNFIVKLRFKGIQEKHRKQIRNLCKRVWREHYSRVR